MRWGEIFLLDSLIGNTDRHQNNWAIVWNSVAPHGDPRSLRVVVTSGLGKSTANLAPAFDNGTSLGYEILERKIPQFMSDEKRLAAYVARGTHHMTWKLGDERLNHAELLILFSKEFPEVVSHLRAKLNFHADDLRSITRDLPTLQLSFPLSTQRLEFMIKLIETRKLKLLEALQD